MQYYLQYPVIGYVKKPVRLSNEKPGKQYLVITSGEADYLHNYPDTTQLVSIKSFAKNKAFSRLYEIRIPQ